MALTIDSRWREAILLTIGLWLFVFFIYLPVLINAHEGDSWTSVALDAATFLVSMALAMPLFAIYRKVEDWPLWQAGVVLLATLVVIAFAQTIFDFMWTDFVANTLQPSWMHMTQSLSRSYSVAFNYIWIYSVNLGLFYVAGVSRRAIAQERVIADARSAAQQARLAALRFQLNPHFLFNTLNAISSMIVTRRNEEAEEMMGKLASFLRASIASEPTDLVPLEDELEVIDDYLAIEAVRFGERLIMDIDADPDTAPALVPSFLLQPLVENAIKYGVSPSRTPVTVRIEARIEGEELVLGVIDDGTGSKAGTKADGTGTGLTNIRRRIEALYGRSGSLRILPTETGFSACIRVPVVTEPPARD